MGTIGFTSISKIVPAATLAAALAMAPAVTAQTPAQDSAAHRTWNIPGTPGGKLPIPTTTRRPPRPPRRLRESPTRPSSARRARQPPRDPPRRARAQAGLQLGRQTVRHRWSPTIPAWGTSGRPWPREPGSGSRRRRTRRSSSGQPPDLAVRRQLRSRVHERDGRSTSRTSPRSESGPLGETADVRQLAANGLPTLEQHRRWRSRSPAKSVPPWPPPRPGSRLRGSRDESGKKNKRLQRCEGRQGKRAGGVAGSQAEVESPSWPRTRRRIRGLSSSPRTRWTISRTTVTAGRTRPPKNGMSPSAYVISPG